MQEAWSSNWPELSWEPEMNQSETDQETAIAGRHPRQRARDWVGGYCFCWATSFITALRAGKVARYLSG